MLKKIKMPQLGHHNVCGQAVLLSRYHQDKLVLAQSSTLMNGT